MKTTGQRSIRPTYFQQPDEHESLTPLLDSLATMYADVPRRRRSCTLRSADSEERNESPPECSDEGSLRGEEPLLTALLHRLKTGFCERDRSLITTSSVSIHHAGERADNLCRTSITPPT